MLPHSRFALSAEERSEGLVLACRAMPRSDLRISWQHSAVAMPEVRHERATVLAKQEIAPSIHRVVLQSAGRRFDFLTGQSYELGFAGAPMRTFSPSSQPGSGEIEFHIRAMPGGAASTVVASRLSPGDSAAINGPHGSANLRETSAAPLLLLAAGSGLAPIKSMLDRSLRVAPNRRISLYVRARSPWDGYLWDELDRLSLQRANLSFRPVVTRSDNGRPTGIRLPEVLDHDFGRAGLGGWEVHAAGPEPFVETMRRSTTSLGATDVHVDAFVANSPRLPEPIEHARGRLEPVS